MIFGGDSNQSIFIPKAVGVKEYAYDEDVNKPHRQSMEDIYFVKDNLHEDASQPILFGVLDGHGGKDVAVYVANQFPKLFVSMYKQNSKNIPELMAACFQRVDEEIKSKLNSPDMGCTASIGYIRLEGSKRVLYFANVGDSSAFLFDEQAIPLTTSHKPTNPKERERIIKAKGTVLMDRLAGILAVSRALGDFEFKDVGLISRPDQVRIELRASNKWIIVASDGLWDVVNEKEISQMIKYKENADEVTKFLLKLAQKRMSRDNISVLCLRIQI